MQCRFGTSDEAEVGVWCFMEVCNLFSEEITKFVLPTVEHKVDSEVTLYFYTVTVELTYLSGTLKIGVSNVSPSAITTCVCLFMPVHGCCVDPCLETRVYSKAEAVRALRAGVSVQGANLVFVGLQVTL